MRIACVRSILEKAAGDMTLCVHRNTFAAPAAETKIIPIQRAYVAIVAGSET